MGYTERRSSKRWEEDVTVSLVTEATQLECKTTNVGPRGVLVRGSGRIAVQLHLEGTEYRGSLVRAHPLPDGSILRGQV